jgi:hypothetical protein
MNTSSSESPWRKSSYSSGAQSQCVEVAASQGTTLVRDTSDRGRVTLSVPTAAWTAFLTTLR